MDISISKDSTNKLLDRRELWASLTYEGKTPSRDEIKEALCKKLNLDPSLTVIVRISQLYGRASADVEAHSYTSKEAMAIEHKHILERGVKKEKKEGAAPAATAAAPAKEEKKEEKAAKAEK